MRFNLHLARLATLLALGGGLAPAHAITGAWSGEMAGSDGDRVPLTYTFSPRGGLLLQMPSSSGMREAEIGYVGQAESWRPPNGGVATGRVLSVSAGAAHFQARVSISADRQLFDGVLQQERIQVSFSFQQQGDAVHATIQQRTESTTVGGPFVPRPQVAETLYRGVLRQP